MKIDYIVYISTLISFILFGISVKYCYIDEVTHFHKDSCLIDQCESKPDICCPTDRSCRPCYIIVVTYSFSKIINDTNILINRKIDDISYNMNYCNKTKEVCYYDDRDIESTLRLWDEYSIAFWQWLLPGILGCISFALLLLSIQHIVFSYRSHSKKDIYNHL